MSIDAVLRREVRQRDARTIQAWQAANFQGLKPEKLLAMLEPDERKRRKATTDELMTTMAKWRAVMAVEYPPTAPNPGSAHG